jgi:general secretion pathway protein M
MTTNNPIIPYLARFPVAAAVLYGGLVVTFLSAAVFQTLDLIDRQQAVSTASDTLSELEKRSHLARKVGGDPSIATGSPFLDDSTVTVAGATLLQRVASAVTRAGGNIVSSEVELQGPLAKEGFVGVTANCELDQPALQKLLYDLEAGMPFLYVDEIEVEAPGTSAGTTNEKLRVMISVSAQWQGAK